MNQLQRGLTAFGLVAALLASASGPSLASEPPDRPTGTPSEAPSDTSQDLTLALAAEQLAEDQTISIDEAMLRMKRQDRLQNTAAALAKRPTSAGAFIDQEGDGDLVVLDTDARGAKAALARAENVEVRSARWTTSELLAASRDLMSSAGLDEGEVMFSSDVRSNAVTAWVPPDSPKREMAQRLGRVEGPLRVAVEDRSLESTSCQSGLMLCDAPLRGGIGMLNDEGEVCSAGFNVQSIYDSKKYVLTAGHCITLPGVANFHNYKTEFANRSIHMIGDPYTSTLGDGSGTDYGLVDLDNPTGWNPQWWVFVRDSASTTYDPEYSITGTGSSTPGMYLCKSGAATKTRCGVVYAVGASHPQNPTWNMGVLVAKNCGGDSGGPVYIGHRAYGITSSGDTGNQIASESINNGLSSGTVPCYSVAWYGGINQALDETNTKLIGT